MHSFLGRHKLFRTLFRNQQVLGVIEVKICHGLDEKIFDALRVFFDVELVVHYILLICHILQDGEAHHLVDACHFRKFDFVSAVRLVVI